MKIKRIKFIDTGLSEGQSDMICTPLTIEVCGFVIQETDKYITLASELLSNGDYRHQISIPKVAIIKRKGK